MIARHLRLMAVALAALVPLATTACSNSKPPIQRLPEISFANRGTFNLNVAELEILPEYVPPGRAPNIEHQIPVAPGKAMERWALDRIRPVGARNSGYARLVIKDARVTETPLSVDKGLSGAFKTQQELRYDARLQVTIEIQDARHMTLGSVDASAARSRTVAEGLTVNERDRILYEITESLAQEVDEKLTALIPGYLGRWLVR